MKTTLVEYPDKELTEKIIGAAFEVHNTLGVGFLEKVYQNALAKKLKLQGLRAELEIEIPVYGMVQVRLTLLLYLWVRINLTKSGPSHEAKAIVLRELSPNGLKS